MGTDVRIPFLSPVPKGRFTKRLAKTPGAQKAAGLHSKIFCGREGEKNEGQAIAAGQLDRTTREREMSELWRCLDKIRLGRFIFKGVSL